jgi:hypothetical protein
MSFDIHRLDDLDDFDEELVTAYDDELLDLFVASPEGQTFARTHPNLGFWASRMLDYGRSYTTNITEMDEDDVEELLTDVFPRKISLGAPKETDDGIPELIAFWKFLEREFKLPNAGAILSYLRSVKPEQFRAWMNDSERFGMAKSLFLLGQSAGFDMTSEEGGAAFMNYYNANLARPSDPELDPALLSLLAAGLEPGSLESGGRHKKDPAKARHKRKIARASRKKNRKRK